MLPTPSSIAKHLRVFSYRCAPFPAFFPGIHQPPSPGEATAEYVEFLLAVASDSTSSVAQVLAAMVPCMRLYAFLGQVGRR